MFKLLLNKLKDGYVSIIPIYLLIIILNFTPYVSLSTYEILVLSFATFIGGLGIALFNMGTDIAMTPMGKLSGQVLTRQGKIIILLIFLFLLGFFVTLAEPNLSILSSQIKTLLSPLLITISIAFGVGLALILLIIRLINKLDLAKIFIFLYGICFALAILVIYTGTSDFLGFIYDAGGVTTGPVTVPFMMAICIGVSSVIAKKSDKDMSFGLIGIVCVMTIIVMLILGIFISYNGDFILDKSLYVIDTNFGSLFLTTLLSSFKDVAISLVLIAIFFLVINFIFIKLPNKKLFSLGIGVIYSFFGLSIFLTAVNMAFMPVAYNIGSDLASNKWLLYVVGFLVGGVSVLAEPAVHVLVKQVNEITDGIIKKKTMLIGLIIGGCLAITLAILRINFQFPIMYILIPAVIFALTLSFFIPKIYVGIAFDSGGVAAGALTSGFILPLAIGICDGFLYSDSQILSLGFGVVALVSITPVIVIEFVGLQALISDKIKMKRQVDKMILEDDEVIVKFR